MLVRSDDSNQGGGSFPGRRAVDHKKDSPYGRAGFCDENDSCMYEYVPTCTYANDSILVADLIDGLGGIESVTGLYVIFLKRVTKKVISCQLVPIFPCNLKL